MKGEKEMNCGRSSKMTPSYKWPIDTRKSGTVLANGLKLFPQSVYERVYELIQTRINMAYISISDNYTYSPRGRQSKGKRKAGP